MIGLGVGANDGEQVLCACDCKVVVVRSMWAVSCAGQVVSENAGFDTAFAHGKYPWSKEQGDEWHGKRAGLGDRVGTGIWFAKSCEELVADLGGFH